MNRLKLIATMVALIFSFCTYAEPVISPCLYQKIQSATDDQTIGELKQACAEQEQQQTLKSAIKRRVVYEQMQRYNPFSLQSHRPNYLIISNNFAEPHEKPFDLADPNRDFDFQPWETKFQISVKMPIAYDLIAGNGDLYAAYTNRSFWQMLNKEGSAPFRDSNHEPEIWLSFSRKPNSWMGWSNPVIRTGLSHQSNGQSGVLSRSWNRLYADFIFERENLSLSFKPWWRIPDKHDEDDNPDIDRYLGNFELRGLYKYNKHNFELMVRNNLRSDNNRGAFEFGWSYPLNLKSLNANLYLQWFNGYGESLIDYNAHTNSIGLGIKLADWL